VKPSGRRCGTAGPGCRPTSSSLDRTPVLTHPLLAALVSGWITTSWTWTRVGLSAESHRP
jgi:hypothetical protein